MSSNNDPTPSTSTEPFVWVLIPLVVIFSMGTFVIFIWRKRRGERYAIYPAWPEERGTAAANDDAHGQFRQDLRWPSRGPAARSTEGLNELGEAPPPYDAKKLPETGDGHGTAANESSTSETGTGTGPRDRSELPPGYPAQPSSTYVAISRREQ
ncbi:hypothetical protein E4U43_000358 [Claviceps pusilla]|uniref:Uncharacterized protein n=1 Tax=Claviceps pusilla TaxID=123648 RepID=A0A9P7NAT2_9HYPO|nr:hypothetical protein E4U43_000358 [Claviceps pusilla]